MIASSERVDMVQIKDIQATANRIGRQFRPERVILFGSHAHGTADEDSDVDLLVIMPHKGRALDKAVEIRLSIHPPFPTDVIVRDPETVRRRIRQGDLFLRDAVEHGKILYESHRGGMDREG
jgi:predicted nucleotidyltransferase